MSGTGTFHRGQRVCPAHVCYQRQLVIVFNRGNKPLAPDIATQVRFRKQEELQAGITQLTGEPVAERGTVKMLTSCPACQQGLDRYRDETGLETDYIVVELANHLLGENWQTGFVDRLKQGGVERVLL